MEGRGLLCERDGHFLELEMGLSVYKLRELIEIMEFGEDKIPYDSIYTIGKTTGRHVLMCLDKSELIEYHGDIPQEAYDVVKDRNCFWLFGDYWEILVNIARGNWSHDDVLQDLKVYSGFVDKIRMLE